MIKKIKSSYLCRFPLYITLSNIPCYNNKCSCYVCLLSLIACKLWPKWVIALGPLKRCNSPNFQRMAELRGRLNCSTKPPAIVRWMNILFSNQLSLIVVHSDAIRKRVGESKRESEREWEREGGGEREGKKKLNNSIRMPKIMSKTILITAGLSVEFECRTQTLRRQSENGVLSGGCCCWPGLLPLESKLIRPQNFA